MPNFDTTGPTGQGSQTGRGFGQCASDRQGNPAGSRGFGGCFWRKDPITLETREKILEAKLEEVRKLKKNLQADAST